MVNKDSTSEKIAAVSKNLEVWRVRLDDLYEQDKNARSMSPETFDRLVQNIRNRGELESLPLCHMSDNGRVYVISGHHRVRAARSAEIDRIPVLVDVSNLTQSEVVAKQLAHNAIQGKDDRQLLSELYEELKTVDDMLASHLDPKELGLNGDWAGVSLEDIRVDFAGKTVVFAMLPSEVDRFQEFAERIQKDVDFIGTDDEAKHQSFVSVLNRVGIECEIRNVGAMVSKMTDLVGEYLGEPSEDESWVSLGHLFGRTTVPPETADIIQQAIVLELGEKESTAKNGKNKWMALERWAHGVVNR